ncbi:MAG TPA: MFS transporter [Stellaceae bacterium]|nr:MFS transporter [Stellaceae bacterium]
MAGGETRTARPARFHYAWVVVAIGFVTFLAAAGIRSAPTVLIVPLEEEFGWTRADISFAVGLQLLIYGLVGPFAAGIAERFGLRVTLLGAIALSVVSFGATALVSAPWHLALVWGVGTGLGTGAAALVLAAIIANRWFFARRGLALGVLTASAAGGQLVFLPVMAAVIGRFGWRPAIAVACAGAMVALPLLYFFMRDRPSDLGLRALGTPADAPPEPPRQRGNPFAATFLALGDVLGRRDFWLLSMSFFVCGATTFGFMGTHFIPACLDHGITEESAANLMASMGVFALLGTLLSGALTDRFDSRHLLCGYYGLRGLSLFFIPYALDNTFLGLVFLGLFNGLDYVATVPPTMRLTTSIFGLERAGIVYGWIMVVHQFGAAAAAYAAGLLRTELGNYTSAFILSGVLCLGAAAIVLRVGRPPAASPRPALATAEA